MRAENVVRGDASAAEPTVDHRDADRLAAQLTGRQTIGDLARTQLFEMRRKHFTHLRAGLETMFGLVLDGPHQDAFHFTGKPRIDLTRTRILCEIENQQWIILRVRSGQEMKHRRA